MKKVLVISFLSCMFLYTSANSKANITSPVYDTLRTDAICPIIYPDTTGNETLRAFRKAYQLREVVESHEDDLVAFSEDQPLSAMELRKAIDTAPTEIEVLFKGEWGSENLIQQVINWYSPYLYFFDTAFDNRYGVSEKGSCSGDTRLFLVPLGEKAPEIFQGHHPLTGFATTHSVADFYQEPVFEPSKGITPI